jgi:hypothetical protein
LAVAAFATARSASATKGATGRVGMRAAPAAGKLDGASDPDCGRARPRRRRSDSPPWPPPSSPPPPLPLCNRTDQLYEIK